MGTFEVSAALRAGISRELVRSRAGKGNAGKFKYRCFAHDDEHPSAEWDEAKGVWWCYACKSGGGALDLARGLGIDVAAYHERRSRGHIVATYDYRDESGGLLYQVVRYTPKTFKQRRPNAAGGWKWKLGDVRRVLYRLPELLAAPGASVFVCEGEKDANALAALGLVATTNAGGAEKWRDEYADELRGRDVVILPDNDDVGRDHGAAVARSLDRKAASVRVVALPDLPLKGDVSDWIAAGGSRERLEQLVASVDECVPEEPRRTRLIAAGALLDEPDELQQWRVHELLPEGGLSLLVAKPKVGKSVTARNLARSVAAGAPFLGRATVQGTVVYFALEEKRADVRRHLRTLGANRLPIFCHVGPVPPDVEPYAWLREEIREHRAALAIIDPLGRFVRRVKDMNDYAALMKASEPLIAIAHDTGCHILFLHHGRKGETGDVVDSVLGSTAIAATVDSILGLRKRLDGTRTLETVQRTGNDLRESVVTLDKVTATVALAGVLEERRVEDATSAVLAAVVGDKPLSKVAIRAKVGGNNVLVDRAIALLLEQGRLGRQGAGKKDDPYLYSSPEAAKQAKQASNHPETPADSCLPAWLLEAFEHSPTLPPTGLTEPPPREDIPPHDDGDAPGFLEAKAA